MFGFPLGLIEGLKATPYIFDSNLSGLIEDAPNPKNITISAVSLNRVELTLRLLRSIGDRWPSFQGEIIIFDNGSEPKVLAALKEFAEASALKITLMEGGTNLGPALARNQILQACQTEWLILLDNDMYFVSDPLTSLSETVKALGVNFFNLPFLGPDQREVQGIGGSLLASLVGKELRLNCGSAFSFRSSHDLKLTRPFLSTFMCAGASCVRTSSFRAIGGFAEPLYAFEDLELSIRLYKAGLKVGNAHRFHLIHAHERAANPLDLEYERVRHSQAQNKAAADYIFTEHGISVWSEEVERWLQDRLVASGLAVGEPLTVYEIGHRLVKKIQSKGLLHTGRRLWEKLLFRR